MLGDAKQILENFVPLAKSIAKMFGHHCEVVIHDLTNPQASVMFTVNNHVTGRKVGDPFDHLVKTVLRSEDFKEDFLAGYTFLTDDNRTIRSSTTLIRDKEQKIIGAFCINFDIGALQQMQEFINSFLVAPSQIRTGNLEEIPLTEMEKEHVEEIVDQLIQRIIQNSVHPNMQRQDKINLIRFMDEKGIFLMKGSVDKVASLLGISRVTVYSYLDEVRKHETKEN